MGVSDVELIEANARKCAFLTEVARLTKTRVVIHNARVEATNLAGTADVITARALAPLPKLLSYAERFIGPNTTCLFLKGRRLHQELTAAKKTWKMGITTIPSLSDAGGTVLCLKALARDHDAIDANRV
jgi:16S rRNA (guanine527-N7)-methyltransferase